MTLFYKDLWNVIFECYDLDWHCDLKVLLKFRLVSKKLKQIVNGVLKKSNKKYPNWWGICNTNDNLNMIFIREFRNQLGWMAISCQNLDEMFMQEFSHKIMWHNASLCQNMSENFMRKNKHLIKWEQIPYNKKLQKNQSENFMEEFDITWDF